MITDSPKYISPNWVQTTLVDILEYCKVINQNQVNFDKRIQNLESGQAAIQSAVATVVNDDSGVASALSTLVSTEQTVAAAVQTLVSETATDSTSIAQILEILTTAPTPPPSAPAVAFQVEVADANALKQKGEIDMAAKAKTIKFKVSILDNGTAQGTITGIVDAAGLPTTFDDGTVPTWVCSTQGGAQDPSIVLTPAADGMSCVVAPSTPPALVSGDVLTVTAVGPVMGTLTGTYRLVNVVAGPANSFVVSVQ